MSNFRSAKVIQVIKVETLEGNGQENNPFTIVTIYLDFDGNVLATRGQNKSAEQMLDEVQP